MERNGDDDDDDDDDIGDDDDDDVDDDIGDGDALNGSYWREVDPPENGRRGTHRFVAQQPNNTLSTEIQRNVVSNPQTHSIHFVLLQGKAHNFA